ncbi:MAG: DUF3703 domain-containing protein [Sphingopyxis sp.]
MMPDHRSAGGSGASRATRTAEERHGAYRHEIDHFRRARRDRDWAACWRYLERAHIIARPLFRLHISSHFEMLSFAVSRGDTREIFGQLLRIMLVPLGALTGQLPAGNTGRARVSAFVPMTVPDDLQPYVRPGAR